MLKKFKINNNNVGVIYLCKYFSGVTATRLSAILWTYMTSRIVNITIRERVWTTLTPNESPILKKVGTHAVVFLINPDSKKILKIPKYQM